MSLLYLKCQGTAHTSPFILSRHNSILIEQMATETDETLKARYNEVPYETHVFVHTHPDHLAMVAQIFGVETTPVTKARVLELGCGNGNNIIPMACTLPESQFIGVDFAEQAVNRGKKIVDRLGLKNLELKATSILDLKKDLGRFDYIIAHGVYSWVSDDVKDRMLGVCNDLLSDNGVAYISYNCYPGWHFRDISRHLMLFHSAKFPDPRLNIHQAKAIMQFMGSLPLSETGVYRAVLQQEQQHIQQFPDSYLYHDYLEKYNDPCYFYQFMERAAAHDLQYLSDAELSKVIPQEFPEEVQKTLGKLSSDVLELEQYMDFLRCRPFRRTILCRKNLSIKREFDAANIKKFYISSSLVPNNDGNKEIPFRHGNGGALVCADPALKAAVQHLSSIWPNSVSFSQLLEIAKPHFQGLISNEKTLEAQQDRIASAILRCALAEIVELRTYQPPIAKGLGLMPKASAIARVQAAEQDLVTNLLHQCIHVTPFTKELIQLLDGQKDFEAILKALQENGTTEDRKKRSKLVPIVDRQLRSLLRNALLTV